MTYIGIDQSYRQTGIAAIDENGELIKTRAIKSDAGMNLRGLRDMSLLIAEAIEYIDSDPVVAIEGNSVASSNSKTARALAELSGAIKMSLAPLDVRESHMSSWKSKIAYNRLRGVKKQTAEGAAEYLQIIADITGVYLATTDEADAYCIAEYCRKKDAGLI